jgi:hypothetical protein
VGGAGGWLVTGIPLAVLAVPHSRYAIIGFPLSAPP